jgi:hypothetical protein
MTGVYEIRPAEWWDWPFHGVIAEQASIPAVTTLPASDDQQAVTVRFSYPGDAMCRGSLRKYGTPEGESFEWQSGFAVMRPSGVAILPSSPDWASEVRELRAWKESAMSVLAEWDKVWETLGKPGRLGDSIAVASKKEIERLQGQVNSLIDELRD